MLWFSLIKHVPRTFIPTNLIPHACMLAKGFYLNPRKFIPTKITRYTVFVQYLILRTHTHTHTHTTHTHTHTHTHTDVKSKAKTGGGRTAAGRIKGKGKRYTT